MTADVDVIAPCALGGVLNDDTVPALRCKAIAGAANNQLASDALDAALAERGILWAPDFVCNAGGIINICVELEPEGYAPERADTNVRAVGDTLRADLRLRRGRAAPRRCAPRWRSAASGSATSLSSSTRRPRSSRRPAALERRPGRRTRGSRPSSTSSCRRPRLHRQPHRQPVLADPGLDRDEHVAVASQLLGSRLAVSPPVSSATSRALTFPSKCWTG